MNIFERLAQANQLRSTIAAVNATRRELSEEPRPADVVIVAEFRAARICKDGQNPETRVASDVRAALIDWPRDVLVQIPAGLAPEHVRDLLGRIVVEYAAQYATLCELGEATAANVLGEPSEPDEDYDEPWF